METGIAYALVAALFWGTSPVLVKRGLRHSNVSAAVLLQQVGSVLTLVLIMVLPFGDAQLQMPWAAAGVFAAVGLVGSFLGRTFVLKGIDEIGASKAQSISNSAPLLTAVYAIVLLGETATPIILIGVVLIVTGLLIITRGTPDDKVTGRPVSYKAFLNPPPVHHILRLRADPQEGGDACRRHSRSGSADHPPHRTAPHLSVRPGAAH